MLEDLLEKNRHWAEQIKSRTPDFFSRLSAQQKPEYLWIGCSDSRVPANQIVDLQPGEIFVHRNVANMVVHTDLNCLSVIQYAVEVLGIRHIIVCGHYGCGGVVAALDQARRGLIDNWLANIKDVYNLHQKSLEALDVDRHQLADRLCELNVIEQVKNVSETTILQQAWDQSIPVRIHGWIYGLKDGLIKDLNMSAASTSELEVRYQQAVSQALSV